MKRSFKLENLCCANCAAKIEDKINKVDGVSASLSFMSQRLNLEADDMDYAVAKAEEIINKVEPDCVLVK
ncbi:MAG: cation transporter [Firmicutes bacterium]|nr:cation transporter [Bacillota bacterium]